MRKSFFLIPILVLLVLVVILASFNRQDRWDRAMPEKIPDDFNFSVSFGYGTTNKNEINTFDSTITKDLIANGTITTHFVFSEDEMMAIYNRMYEINILRDLELVSQSDCRVIPYQVDRWEIQISGKALTFEWSGENCGKTEDAQKLFELRKFIFNMVKNKKEYENLPDAVGGYD